MEAAVPLPLPNPCLKCILAPKEEKGGAMNRVFFLSLFVEFREDKGRGKLGKRLG